VTRPRRLRALGQWLILGSTVGVVSGSASALFLTLLDLATETREAHEGLVFALPAAGLFIGWFYERYGAPIRGGNNLVIDTLHTSLRQDGPALPLRMAPMVLFGTVLTHLFGGSAGREGTAVQMGASLADALAHRLGLPRELRRQLLIAGVAGGFGSVFGTPVAGALFGLELPTLGRIDSRAAAPALVAALVGDMTTRAWGVTHSAYPLAPTVALGPGLALRWLLFAGAVALVSAVFIELTHHIKGLGERLIPRLPLRLFVGGAALVGLWQLAGTSDYLGLGVPTILRAFSDPALPAHTFALKLLFTSLTLGVGFLGGEVTPLFFIGAALGSALSPWIGVPTALGAGVGLAAVFGAASNTPIALSIMAVELLGAGALPHVALVSVAACFFKGKRSIYPAQRAEG
jgi:H+/Cl- antiporter ClcA